MSHLFSVELEDASILTSILKELHPVEDQSVLAINQDGLRIIIASEKVYQVSVFFGRSIFRHFEFEADSPINFRIVLRDFIATLSLPLDDPAADKDKLVLVDDHHHHHHHHHQQNDNNMKTTFYMQYRKRGEPIMLKLENKTNCLVECDLKAFNMPSNSMFCPLAFHDSEDYAMIDLNSKKLYDYVSGLDFSGEHVHVSMGKCETPLKISTSSTSTGEVELSIPKNESDIICKLTTSDNMVYNYSYKTEHIKPALEALKTSHTMRLKIGASGLLCIEHFHEEISSVEYFIQSEVMMPL